MEEARLKMARIERDYNEGCSDCKQGVYDKSYRYHRRDNGEAYDLGWTYQNEIERNETVKFISAD
jgi:hypothetical protein